MTDCDAIAHCKGYCKKHYDYLRKHGTPYYEPKIRRLGQTKDPLYKTYAGMVARCTVKSNQAYKKYGERGIKVCEKWLGADGFFNFKKDMGERPAGYTLDRVDPFGDYCPENCRWASIALQSVNKRKRSPYFRGVYKHSKCGYVATIRVNNEVHRKHFMEVEDAIDFRLRMEEKLLGGQLCAR
jgi:hypothetical protein